MVATLKGSFGQTTLEAAPNPYTIGRTPDNQLVVNDSKASSHHAQIRYEGQGYEVIDLGSRNGTYVNEQQLVPHVPHLLSVNDQIRIGDTTFVFEADAISSQPSHTSQAATVYGGSSQGYIPALTPTFVAPAPSESFGVQQSSYVPEYMSPVSPAPPAPLPYAANSYGVPPQGAYAPPSPSYPPANNYIAPQGSYGSYPPPPVQQQKPRRRALWIILGVILGLLLIATIALGAVGYANRSTTTKTLNAFCSALKGGDYQTAYNQLSSGLQARYGSEAAFAAAFSTNGGFGKVNNCAVNNINDGANTGTITYVFSGSSNLVVDYTLTDENNALKINAQHPRSTPSLTLNTYCTALAEQDYQSAYNQLSASLQSQAGTQAQFAASATANNIKGCNPSNVSDTEGTGTVTYSRSDGNKTSAAATLVNQNGTWKINVLQSISSPTETLLTYCSALKAQDYQTAYAQLTSTAQAQETEAQFAANFKSITVTQCVVSNVSDVAGTGEITYTLGSRGTGTFDYILFYENGSWKINSERQHA